LREFWVASGHHLTQRDARGWLRLTDALLLAWLARPELLPPPEACAAERALHSALLANPRRVVAPGEVAAMTEADARENWGFWLAMRDALLAAGTVEGGYLALVRQGVRLPLMLLDQLVQLVLRNALDGCDDPHTLRAAELFFRPQKGHVRDGALILADAEVVAEIESLMHSAPLTAMFSGGVQGLDVLGAGNAWTYWSRSDAHTMALNLGGDPLARAGLATAIAAFVAHLLGQPVMVAPHVSVERAKLGWYVGLDPVGTAIGDALWRGAPEPGAMVGLFSLDFVNPAAMLPKVAGQTVWCFLGLGPDDSIRMKPQNLITGLPLA
jgi:hypothetical protein